MRAIIKGVIVPFVKARCVEAIKSAYTGTKENLLKVLREIEQIDINDRKAIQLILIQAVGILDITVIEDRKAWLFEFDNSVKPEQ